MDNKLRNKIVLRNNEGKKKRKHQPLSYRIYENGPNHTWNEEEETPRARS